MLEQVIDGRRAEITPGFGVRRILPYRKRRMVGPFVFLDHGGPLALPPERRHAADVLPHPHIGLATVTYLLGGHLVHRDSLGTEQVIRPHEVNWMTAGRGIAHSERFPAAGASRGAAEAGDDTPLELLQSWCALPDVHEEDAPSFAHHAADTLPVLSEGSVWMRLIAGGAFGLSSPVRCLSPLFYLHAELQAGATIALPQDHVDRAAYVVRGCVTSDGASYRVGQLLVFAAGGTATVAANDPATVMLLGGEPLGERFIWWNFVSSRKARIEQAKDDWRSGRIALPPNDDREFVPLPEDGRRSRPPAAEPLS